MGGGGRADSEPQKRGWGEGGGLIPLLLTQAVTTLNGLDTDWARE